MILAQATAATGSDSGPNLFIVGLLALSVAAVVIVLVLLLPALFGSRDDSDRK